MIVRQLINSALRKLGVYASGESATAAEIEDALDAVNRMLNSWSTDSNGVHTLTAETKTLTSGDGRYTYGSGGDIDSARPVKILEALIRSDDYDYPVNETTRKNWMDIGNKATEGRPRVFLYEPAYPLGTLDLWPIPDDDYDLVLYAQKPLAQYTNSGDDLDLPPEYEEAIEWNLALRLAPEYVGASIPPLIVSMAQETLTKLKTLHAQPIPQIATEITRTRGRTYNIYEDE
jgi:hypothetical protein